MKVLRSHKVTLIIFAFIGTSCTYHVLTEEKNQGYNTLDSTYLMLKDIYYWNSLLPDITTFEPRQFHSPSSIVQKARTYSPINPALKIPADRWSFAITEEEWSAMLNGEFNDFGIGLRFLSADDLRIAWVQPNSSAGKNNVTRGIRVLKINNIIPSFDKVDSLNALFTTHDELDLTLKQNDQDPIEIRIVKSNYEFSPVINHQIFNLFDKKTGYIHLISFIGSANDQLKNIFSEFKQAGITELIVDLRYNGGGLLSVMENLASYVVPDHALNSIFYQIIYNQNYTSFNEKIFFKINPDRLPNLKIKFIISPNTASASEVLIQSLRPYLTLELIGLPSHGKLFGMQTIRQANYIIVPVSFLILNATETSRDIAYRILPDYEISDDLMHDFSEKELNISKALENFSGGRVSYPPPATSLAREMKNFVGPQLLPFAILDKY